MTCIDCGLPGDEVYPLVFGPADEWMHRGDDECIAALRAALDGARSAFNDVLCRQDALAEELADEREKVAKLNDEVLRLKGILGLRNYLLKKE
jgi:hypothetical protein